MAGFLEYQLDTRISYGTSGGLGYNTTVVSNQTRKETRFILQSRGLWKFSITFKNKSKSFLQGVQAFYASVAGKAYGWRFRNNREYYTCTDDYASGISGWSSEPISTYAGGTTMQLIHTRNPGKATAEIVPIVKPDLTLAIILYRDGSLTAWPSGNYTLNTATGIVTFSVSQTGHTFAWKGQWDTPVRFDVDDSEITWDDYDVANMSIPIVEIVP